MLVVPEEEDDVPVEALVVPELPELVVPELELAVGVSLGEVSVSDELLVDERPSDELDLAFDEVSSEELSSEAPVEVEVLAVVSVSLS